MVTGTLKLKKNPNPNLSPRERARKRPEGNYGHPRMIIGALKLSKK